MQKNTHSGLFIAFEGLDGSGVSVQATLLSQILIKEGYRVHFVKEPSNNLIGGLIRAQLTGEWKTNPETLQLLFAADRAHHLNSTIIPKLVSGQVVISDRYAFSSMAYGSQEIKNENWLAKINDSFILPDITFLIKADPKNCAREVKKSHYEIELFKKTDEMQKVWKAYLKLTQKYKNIYIINGEQEKKKIIEDIVKIVKKRLGLTQKK